MRMISKIVIMMFLLFGLFSCSTKKTNVIDYVNPFIGTDGIGHTFPGATVPFGMVQLSPSDNTPEWNWCSGYHYSDNTLKGFAHNHFSGTGLAGMGDVLLMPTIGEAQFVPGTKENPDLGYRSRFSHDNETASPGYYSVLLDDYDVDVELTTTARVGVHRYTFNKEGNQNVIFDLTHGILQRVFQTSVECLSDTEIIGSKNCHDVAGGNRTVYFYAKFSKPFNEFTVVANDSIVDGYQKMEGKNTKAFVRFYGDKGNEVEVAVAISYVDIEGAKANYEAEAKGKTFDLVYAEARELWMEKISKIEIEGASENEKSIFYTSMYHSFITPNIISDVNGNYIVEGKKYNSPDIVQYSNFSTWDTYRATHPLWSIIDQKANNDMVKVLTSRFTQSGTGLALWEALGFDNVCMIGYPGISAMAEAALKHPEGLDKELIFECIKESSFRDEKFSYNYGSDNGVRYYVDYGFVPGNVGSSIAKTTEYNYYDFCIAQLARDLEKEEDCNYFKRRSLGYRNTFNDNTNYLWPRFTSGKWKDMDTTKWSDLTPNYVSGNIWAYSAYTPHDMLGAIKLFGGKEKYDAWLTNIIETPLDMDGEQHVDIAGFIGKYSHGDEPGHQIPYLFNFVGKPWKTQALARRVMTEMYSHKPDGYVNNEDCGQMSSWYIFSSLGFYPIAPCDLNYYFGSPLYPKATVKLENGKTFTVIANKNSDKNKYIQSVTLNGKEIKRLYIKHDEIMAGGELVFQMGPKPNKDWANGENVLPSYYEEMASVKNTQLACYEPKFISDGTLFKSKKEIKLECATEGAKYYYTLDGSTPTEKSRPYKGKITLTKSAVVKVIAVKEGCNNSNLVSQGFIRILKPDLSNWEPSKLKALDKEGNIVQALVVEPFNAPGKSIPELSKLDFLKGEASIKPKMGMYSGDKLWYPVEADKAHIYNFFSLGLKGSKTEAASYLSFWVYTPNALKDGTSKLDFLWGCDDGTRIYINGVLKKEYAHAQGLAKDNYKLESIGLNKGWNHFMIKVTQGGGAWAFMGRFDSSNPNVIKSLNSLIER